MKKRLNPPSREKILNTWWNQPWIDGKDLLAQKTNGKLSLDSQTDRCWCCRQLEDWWLDSKGKIDQSRNISIECCHVIPHSLGGANNPLNFVLMCSDCHRKSPDIKDNTSIFKWMEGEYDKRQKYHQEFIEGMQVFFPEIKSGPDTWKKNLLMIGHVFSTRDSKKFQKWFSKNTSFHFGEAYKASTMVSALRKFIDKYRPFPSCQTPKEVEDWYNGNIHADAQD